MTRLVFVVFFVLAVLQTTATTVAQPRVRDVWHVTSTSDETPFASAHTVVSRTDDGNWRYSVKTRLLVNFLGAQKQETVSTTTLIVDAEYGIHSVEIRGRRLSGEISMDGFIKDGIFVLTGTISGIGQTVELDISDGVIPMSCLEDWLADQSADVDTVQIKVLNEEQWQISEVTAKRESTDDEGTDWKLDFGGLLGAGVYELDNQGVLQAGEFGGAGMKIRRVDADTASRLGYMLLDGRSVLMFPLNKDVSSPDRVKEMHVKITWRDIPYSDFNLNDNRQQVMEHTEKDNNHEALIRIGRNPVQIKDDAAPPTAEQFAKYLSSSQYVKPDDPAIRALAEKLIAEANAETPMEKTKAISKWVFEFIDGTLIAETLTGPQVLESGKGKCSEYSTLFASLARSAGVPTRIALGERMAGGNWIGHMWNEVYVGEWITVDASANEVGDSAALLKFVHSDTVMGTQPLRFALPESLDISIEEVLYRDGSSAGDHNVRIADNVYTNEDYLCRLAAPAKEGWELTDHSEPGVVTIRFKKTDYPGSQIHFVAFALPQGLAAKVISDSRLESFRSMYEDHGLEVLRNESVDVGESHGHTLVYRRQFPDDPQKYTKSTEYIWRAGEFGYLLNIIATEKEHDELEEEFEKILASFEVLSDE